MWLRQKSLKTGFVANHFRDFSCWWAVLSGELAKTSSFLSLPVTGCFERVLDMSFTPRVYCYFSPRYCDNDCTFSFSTFLAVYFCVLTLWCIVQTEIIKIGFVGNHFRDFSRWQAVLSGKLVKTFLSYFMCLQIWSDFRHLYLVNCFTDIRVPDCVSDSV